MRGRMRLRTGNDNGVALKEGPMRLLFARRLVKVLLTGALAVWAGTASAQEVARGGKCATPAAPCPAPQAAPLPEAAPPPAQPLTEAPAAEPLAFAATGGGETFAAVSSAVGYIDSALPISQVRLRNDDAYNSNRPDRAEFFYAKCGCFAVAGLDPTAKGPPLPEIRIQSYQDISPYLEYAVVPRLSVFVEAPVRFINPGANKNASGFADMNAGFKYAWLYSNCQILTTQLRVYAPTGDSQLGLGTHHTSIEPSLLMYQK